jgi:beta-hydroxylase
MLETFRKRRRGLVKRIGKRLIRRLGAFLGQQSKVGTPAIFEPHVFPWAEELEREWKRVRDEVTRILVHRDALPGFAEISPDQYKIAPGDRWKTYFFHAFGHHDPEALRACPETARLLAKIPGLETAFFSIIPGGMHIREHRGITRALIRGHLALIVPGDPADCRMRVGSETRSWEEGRLFVFDDTVRHEVWNDADADRVVLLFDFRRPMRPLGRFVGAAFLRAIRLTAYVRDGLENHRRWRLRYREPG